ncbi:MAG TPA: hypothetical protein VGB97_00225 [Candidatus Paceibacterota bacterium]|jgi:hypothetical protein
MALLIIVFHQKQELYYAQKYEQAIPHIHLESAMVFNGNNAVGSITGFVKFPSYEEQPKQFWQYYTIEATNDYDTNGKQLFIFEELTRLSSMSLRSFGREPLTITSNTPQQLTLEGEAGHIFTINKQTGEVEIIESGGGVVSLITDESEYQDFALARE